MKYEVCINMKNDNALCTISMLPAMLETQDGSYYKADGYILFCAEPGGRCAMTSMSERSTPDRKASMAACGPRRTDRLKILSR